MPRHRLLPIAGWLVALTAAAILLTGLAAALPPVPTSVGDVQASYDRHGIALLALTLLRPIALAAVAYQLVVALVAFVAALTSSATLLGLTRRAPGSIARTIVRHAVGAGLTATAVTSLAPTAAFAQTLPAEIEQPTATSPAVAADAAPASTPTSTIGEPIVMVRLPPADRSAEREDTGDPPPSGAAVMVALDPEADRPTVPSITDDPSNSATDHHASDDRASTALSPTASLDTPERSAPSASPPHSGEGSHTADNAARADADLATDSATMVDEELEIEANAPSDTWQIEAGDHLWAVAAETLADEWGHTPSDDDVLQYWDALVQANHDRLSDPTNPDLVFPGQVLVLPPVPTGAPSATSAASGG